MDIIIALAIGAVAGWLAGQFMKTESSSLLRNMIVGIVGAAIGGIVFPLLGITFSGLLGNIIMATGGAVILLWLIGKMK